MLEIITIVLFRTRLNYSNWCEKNNVSYPENYRQIWQRYIFIVHKTIGWKNVQSSSDWVIFKECFVMIQLKEIIAIITQRYISSNCVIQI